MQRRRDKTLRRPLRYYSDPMMSDIRFQDFEDVLAAAGSMADAAEAHGSLCGALCSM